MRPMPAPRFRRILESKAFRTSEVHRNLLNYLAGKSLAGDADSLKEYTVGLDVFSKPSSYDPRQESVVRMHMARLRQKLAEYYRTEGVDDPVIVDVPKGGFKVTFDLKPLPPEPGAAPAPVIGAASACRRKAYKWELVLAGLLVAAVAVASYFALRLRQVEKTTQFTVPATWTPELRELWAPLIAQDRPLVVCLATEVREAKSAPSVTGLATANGAFLLGQFLSNRIQNVYVTGSDALTMPELTMGNLVYLGQPANRLTDAMPADRQFISDPDGVRNLHPRPGEPAVFADSSVQGSKERDGKLRAHYARGRLERQGRYPVHLGKPHVRRHSGRGGLHGRDSREDAGRGAPESGREFAEVLSDRGSSALDGRYAHRDQLRHTSRALGDAAGRAAALS